MWLFYTKKQVNMASVIRTAHTQDSFLHLGSWVTFLRGIYKTPEVRADAASSSSLHTIS